MSRHDSETRAHARAGVLALILFLTAAGIGGAQNKADRSEQPAGGPEGDSVSFFGNGGEDAASGDEGAKAERVRINGSLNFLSRAYLGGGALGAVGSDSDDEDTTRVNPSARFDLSYKGASTELSANLRLDPDRLKDHPEDVIDEAYARIFLGDFVLEGGKMKIVWGKGDKLHVLDLFNANDYTDFIIPDYIERRIAEPMFHLAWNGPSGVRAEFVWTPTMTPDRLPTEGRWIASQTSTVKKILEQYVGYRYAQLYGNGTNPAAVLAANAYLSAHSDASAFMPDTGTLDYGQYGVRITGSVGPADIGASYYLGRFKTPSVAFGYTGTQVTSVETAYDVLQSFGLEGAAVLGPINTRAEAAYYLTKDIAGDDPTVKNNRLAWLFGFDVDLPVSNLNINIQTIGAYILKKDEILSPLDVDYDKDRRYSNNKIVLKLSDSFNHEKIKPELTFIWGIERRDYYLNPKIEYKILDEFKIELSGLLLFGSRDGEFGSFTDNDFVQIAMKYSY